MPVQCGYLYVMFFQQIAEQISFSDTAFGYMQYICIIDLHDRYQHRQSRYKDRLASGGDILPHDFDGLFITVFQQCMDILYDRIRDIVFYTVQGFAYMLLTTI